MSLPSFSPRLPPLTSLSARRPNPFTVTREMQEYDAMDKRAAREKEEKRSFLQQSLVSRAKQLSPLIPLRQLSPRSARTQRCPTHGALQTQFTKTKRISERLTETRDVCVIQMILDRKKQSIKQINDKMETEQRVLDMKEREIVKDSRECQVVSDKSELILQQAIKAAEEAVRERAKNQKKLSEKHNQINKINFEISKNEELVELYRRYKLFVEDVCPEGMDFVEFFSTPNAMTRILDTMEKENMFVGQQFDIVEDLISRQGTDLDKQIELARQSLDIIEKAISNAEIPEIFNQSTENEASEKSELEAEIEDLSNQVMQLYIECFGRTAVLTPVEAMERVETELEKYYKQSNLVKASFLQQRQKIIDDQRRKETQKRIAYEHEMILQEKKDASIARSNQPIKKRTGRKLMERMIQQLQHKKTDEQILQSQLLKERMDRLLFGSDNMEC